MRRLKPRPLEFEDLVSLYVGAYLTLAAAFIVALAMAVAGCPAPYAPAELPDDCTRERALLTAADTCGRWKPGTLLEPYDYCEPDGGVIVELVPTCED